LSGQTMMLRARYASGQYVLASTSNTNGTIGLQYADFSVHTGLAYDRNLKTGVVAVPSGLLTDDYHLYAYRARTDTVGGLQAFRDGTQTAQVDLTGGLLTWDRSLIYQNVRPNFGSGTPVVTIHNTIYVPDALTDAEMARIKESWDSLAALVGPAVTGPVYVIDPLDAPYAAPASFTAPAYIKGVNISGGENAQGSTSYGSQYTYGDAVEFEYWKSKRFTVVRSPHRQARVQPRTFGKLDVTETDRMKVLIDKAASLNMYVVLDPHDYGAITDSANTGFNNTPIGVTPDSTKMFADYWARHAAKWKNYPNVIFGLMNEPAGDGQSATMWRDAAIAAYNAIRATGSNHLILIPCRGFYTRANKWAETQTTIWDAWLATNPTNFMFEMHQYLDPANAGESPIVEADKGATTLVTATDWCRARGVKAFLAEFGWAPSDTQASGGIPSVEGNALVQYMKNNADVWGGWTYWKGGFWKYSQGPYGIAASFTNNVATTADKPQIAILQSGL
jgi:endoglucanase